MALNKTKDIWEQEEACRISWKRALVLWGMYVLNNRTQYGKIYAQALEIIDWKDFPAAA